MRSRYRISLDGVQLDSLDDSILILDVDDPQPEHQIRKQTAANLNGIDLIKAYLGQRTITVTFEIHEYDIKKRNDICRKVNEWAGKGSVLRKNDRTGMLLIRTVCEEKADINSARNWTDPLTLVFRTTDCPHWLTDKATSLQIAGSTSGTLDLDGDRDSALVYVTATASAPLTSYQITVGSTKIKLTGLSVPSGGKIVITYTRGRYLSITANGKDAMPCYDPGSSDQLLAPCGAKTKVTVSANAKVSTTVTARGCWM